MKAPDGDPAPDCNPLDTYCVKTSSADKYFEDFFAHNAGIPGPLSKMTRPQGPPRTTFNNLRDEFIQTRYLAYADDAFKPLAGAPVLPGVARYNAFDMPADYFTRHVMHKERCGCGAADNKFKK